MATKKDISKAKPKKKPGRPKVVIDWAKVDKYLMAGCTGTGIAGILGIHEDTFYRACERDNKVGFAAYSQQKGEIGDGMLKFKQFDLAMKGDVRMLIWLGKQRLDQKDKTDTDSRVTIEAVEPIRGMIIK